MGSKPKPRTRGRPASQPNKFGAWVDSSGLSRQEVADRLGISRRHLDKLCAGTRRPTLDLAFAIEDMTETKVPARFWLTVERNAQ